MSPLLWIILMPSGKVKSARGLSSTMQFSQAQKPRRWGNRQEEEQPEDPCVREEEEETAEDGAWDQRAKGAKASGWAWKRMGGGGLRK